MRDSINYNLNYFIMRMSGTKPMKNTMRKSPIKQEVEAKTYVTSTNNNRAGTSVRGEKTNKSAATIKRADVKSNKPKRQFAPGRPVTRAKVKPETSVKVNAPKPKPKSTTETSIKVPPRKPNPAGNPASKTETSIKVKTPAPKPTATTKPVEGKPSSRPGSTKPKGAFTGAASKAAGIAAEATPMQMKKKC